MTRASLCTFPCLANAGDDADGAELVNEIILRDGGRKARHIYTVVVALLSTVLAANDNEKRDVGRKSGKFFNFS